MQPDKGSSLADEPTETLSIEQLVKRYSTEFNQSKIMEEVLPRQFTNQKQLQSITSNLYYTETKSHLNSLTKALSEPIWDLLDRGGKRWRPILCMLIAEVFGHHRNTVFDIAALCEMVHNGTLIVDDIEDNSKVRRNKECVHLLYGVDISVNAGNFIYFAPMMYLFRSGKYTPECLNQMASIYLEQMTSLHVGQAWDISWHNHGKPSGFKSIQEYPSEDDYLQMTAHKTGVLARLSSRLVCSALKISGSQERALGRLAESMGVAFQIQDDLLNLEGEQYIKTKGYSGQDIHQGKMTLMVIHTIKSSPNAKRLLQILEMKTEQRGLIEEAISIMQAAGSLQYARETMRRIIDAAWKEAQSSFPQGKYKHYLHELAYFNITRKI